MTSRTAEAIKANIEDLTLTLKLCTDRAKERLQGLNTEEITLAELEEIKILTTKVVKQSESTVGAVMTGDDNALND